MGHECLSMDVTDNCINVTASFLKEGKYRERNIQCRILVGADGAGSTVRKLAGITMKGEEDMQKLVSIHFLSKELGHYLLNERPGMLFFIFNTEAIGVLVAHDLNQGEFVLQVAQILKCSKSSCIYLTLLLYVPYAYNMMFTCYLVDTILSTSAKPPGLQPRGNFLCLRSVSLFSVIFPSCGIVYRITTRVR